MLIVGVFALKGLVSPGDPSASQFASDPSPETVTFDTLGPESPPASSDPISTPLSSSSPSQSPSVPLWVFGALGTGCAGGALLVTYLLQQMGQNPLTSERPKRRKVKKVKVKAKKKRPKVPQTGRPPAQMQGPTPPSPSPITPLTPEPQPPSYTLTQPDPQVTVLPPDVRSPMDSTEPDLAEMMDLRKQRSLSSLMHKR